MEQAGLGEQTCVVDKYHGEHVRYTYSKMSSIIQTAAAGLQTLGVVKGPVSLYPVHAPCWCCVGPRIPCFETPGTCEYRDDKEGMRCKQENTDGSSCVQDSDPELESALEPDSELESGIELESDSGSVLEQVTCRMSEALPFEPA